MTLSAAPLVTQRSSLFDRLATHVSADLIIIGGGATGLGLALDARLRGLSVVLLEAADFAKGTSSRATKLVHGGVRYLAQGNIGLVREALRERSSLLRNAPHLTGRLPFVMPSYSCWETPFYGVGLKAYDALAGRNGLGATQFLSARQTQHCLPGVMPHRLKGGVKYWDGQFDDARLALALARTAAAEGALLINYCPVDALVHSQGRVSGVQCHDAETGVSYTVQGRCVVNATGVWVDHIRTLDGDAAGAETHAMVAPSQGVHLVVDAEFLPGDHALLVPKTQDGRVLFAVPWLGKVILGTTDTPRADLPLEPLPYEHEVKFILSEAARYLSKAPTYADIRSVWVGLRPLVRPPKNEPGNTGKLSREHTIQISPTGLVTVTGGKWTTYRAMADDVLRTCAEHSLLSRLPASRTESFKLLGAASGPDAHRSLTMSPGLSAYGNEAPWVVQLDANNTELGGGLTSAMVRFAVRYEYARTVEDVLARRSRLLFLDAALAETLAPAVAALMRQESDHDPQLDAFVALARQYQTVPGAAAA